MKKKNTLLLLCTFFATVALANCKTVAQPSSVLYAPWRDKYQKPKNPKPLTPEEKASPQHCFFCIQIAENNDTKHFILGRYKYHVVMLNLYPYGKGHVLIAPYQHVGDLDTPSQEARIELITLINKSVTILMNTFHPDGFNIGMNIGPCASMPHHLHTHILPRWKYDDPAFIKSIGETLVISYDLTKIYEQLQPAFKELESNLN